MTSFDPSLPGSLLGLGTFPFASVFGDVRPHIAGDVLDGFLSQGGRYIHTATIYASGETEKLLGNLLSKYPRDAFVINTSCGWVRAGDGYVLSGAASDVHEGLAESLERLQLDYVDVHMVHMPDPATPSRRL